MFVEHGPLKSSVVALDHGKTVEGEDVTGLDPSVSQRIVSSISVDP